MSRIYIGDTNVWIHFQQGGLLDELFQLPFTFCSTQNVMDELIKMDGACLLERGLVVEAIDESEIDRLNALRIAHRNSSIADVSCYLLATITGWPLLTSDGPLRAQALKDGIEVHGALWLLDQLVGHGVIAPASAAAALEDMLSEGARFPKRECDARRVAWSRKKPAE